MTLKGTIWGSIIYAVAVIAIAWGMSYANFMFGYRAGADAIMDFLEKGILNKILMGAEIMGCMVMGGLISSYVKMNVALEIVSSTTTFSIQEQFLDAVMPNILPFGFTMLIYFLMKKGFSSLKIIGLIVAVGVICGALGILG